MSKIISYAHFCLFILIISSTCCNAQNTDSKNSSPVNNDSGLGLPKSGEEMKSYLDAGVDPYFVETTDTFSTKGPHCIVRNLIQDKKGNYWFATWHGIVGYDGKTFTNYTLKNSLIHFHVVTLFEDSKGNIWFGTARGGVYRYDDSNVNGESFTLFTVKNGLPNNTINCIAEDRSENIWFGTENGVSSFDGNTFTNYTTGDGLSDNFINAIIKDKSGTMWIGSNNGIDRYFAQSNHKGKNEKLFQKFTVADNLPFKQVVSLFEDKTGNIWIGSWAQQQGGGGLCCYDGKSLRTAITPYFVMYMCQDKKGKLWLAHNKGADNVNFALYAYDIHLNNSPGEGVAITKIIEQSKPDNPVIFGIMEDSSGSIWYGTAGGVCKYDGKFFTSF